MRCSSDREKITPNGWTSLDFQKGSSDCEMIGCYFTSNTQWIFRLVIRCKIILRTYLRVPAPQTSKGETGACMVLELPHDPPKQTIMTLTYYIQFGRIASGHGGRGFVAVLIL